MAVTEKQKKNLQKFTSENANAHRLKGLMKRRSNSELVKLIDANYSKILSLITTCSEDDLVKFLDESKDLPLMLKIYLEDINDPAKRRFVVEQIIDRVKGKPKQSEDVNVSGEVNFRFKFGDE